MTAPLTPRQSEVLAFIADYLAKRGYGPSMRDIARHFKISSTNGVSCHLDGLVTKGFIAMDDRTARSIRLLAQPEANGDVDSDSVVVERDLLASVDHALAVLQDATAVSPNRREVIGGLRRRLAAAMEPKQESTHAP